jgi:hypothetical protein
VSILQVCQRLETTWLGTFVREAPWAFQVFAGIHILGLTASVGILMWFDLRLLGVTLPHCPISHVYRRLMLPWALTGFSTMFITGAILFSGFATKAYGNVFFRVKVATLLLLAVNALCFHRVTGTTIAQWDANERPPHAARLAGLIAIVLWTVVIMAGRMMSYTMF